MDENEAVIVLEKSKKSIKHDLEKNNSFNSLQRRKILV